MVWYNSKKNIERLLNWNYNSEVRFVIVQRKISNDYELIMKLKLYLWWIVWKSSKKIIEWLWNCKIISNVWFGMTQKRLTNDYELKNKLWIYFGCVFDAHSERDGASPAQRKI